MVLARKRHTYVDFTSMKPPPMFAKTTHAILTAAIAQEDYMWVGGPTGEYFEFIQTGANTLMAANGFVHTAEGWKVSLDATNGDAIQITQGMIAGAATPKKFVSGTDAFFVKLELEVTDLNEVDVVMVGFRELAAYAATVDPATVKTDYDHKALFGINDNAGACATEVSIGAGLDTETVASKTVVSGTSLILEVRINEDLTCEFLVDGAEDTLAAVPESVVITAKTFVPTITIVSTGAADGGAIPNVQLVTYECGLQDL